MYLVAGIITEELHMCVHEHKGNISYIKSERFSPCVIQTDTCASDNYLTLHFHMYNLPIISVML